MSTEETGQTPSPPDANPAPGAPPSEPSGSSEGIRAAPTEVEQASGEVLRGTPVAPGLVLGTVHRKDYDLSKADTSRVARGEVERELNRFRRAMDASRIQLDDLKARLEGRVQEADARILDTHQTYLKDSVFIADVENLILAEQMGLEAAIAKVINDFDRIFRLVENDSLRQTAVDLRDVAIRVLRNLETSETSDPEHYVLVARELSIVDMFNLAGEHVQGIVTEEGGLTSHAAIFARSMRIPTLTGVEGLLERVQEGAFVILDATEGVLRVEPDELVRQQYAEVGERPVEGEEIPDWARREPATRDGVRVRIAGMCGNLPEVEQAAAYGLGGVGLYRTELLYLVDKAPPSREAMTRHYESVVQAARAGPVTFRLLNADSGMGLEYLHGTRERNPQLGRAGVRVLLAREPVLRRQLQAILLGGHGADLRIAVPFVTDCGELRRIKEVLFEERLELRKGTAPFCDQVQLGAVLETPVSLLGVRDLAREADFLTLNLDSLVQHLMAADRENAELLPWTSALHPFVLRALGKTVRVAADAGVEITVFGVTAFSPQNLSALLGLGLRHFAIPPSALRAFLEELATIDSEEARRAEAVTARASCLEETRSHVQGYRHGYAADGH